MDEKSNKRYSVEHMATSLKKKNNLPSTQKYLYISEVKQDTVILKDGTLRAVLLVSSINFALKSEDEQQAIIQGYISFLNSLAFEIQIVIQSRKLDISKYLDHLDELGKQQTNELLKVQTREYRQYIAELVTLADIMQKNFYVVVPYSPFSKKRKSWFSRAEEVLFPSRIVKLADEKFEKYKKELDRRVAVVAGGLSSIGLKVTQLTTEELIRMYYQMYNPTRGDRKPLPSLEQLQVEDIQP
jgi:type IV secretory pathway VirB4 component